MLLSNSDKNSIAKYARYYSREFLTQIQARSQGQISFGSGHDFEAYQYNTMDKESNFINTWVALRLNKISNITDEDIISNTINKIVQFDKKYRHITYRPKDYPYSSIEDLCKYYSLDEYLTKRFKDIDLNKKYYGYSKINHELHAQPLSKSEMECIYNQNKISNAEISILFSYLLFFKKVNQRYGIHQHHKKRNTWIDIIKSILTTRQFFNERDNLNFESYYIKPDRYIYASRMFWNMVIFYRCFRYIELAKDNPSQPDQNRAWQKLMFARKRYFINTDTDLWDCKLGKHVFLCFADIKKNRMKELYAFIKVLEKNKTPELKGEPLTDISFNLLMRAIFKQQL